MRSDDDVCDDDEDIDDCDKKALVENVIVVFLYC